MRGPQPSLVHVTLTCILTWLFFLYARLKNGTYYGNTCGRRVVGRAVWRRPQGFRPLSQRVFSRSLSNLVNMLVCIMSRPSSITSQPPDTQKLWPFNCPKLRFPLSKSKSFCPGLIKLSEYVGGHNISTRFYNLPNPHRHSSIMALELSKT